MGQLSESQLASEFKALTDDAAIALKKQGFSDQLLEFELYLNLRYQGTNSSLMIRKPEASWDFATGFIEHHRKEFGFTLNRDILVEDIRVRALGKTAGLDESSVSRARKYVIETTVGAGKSVETTELYTASE